MPSDDSLRSRILARVLPLLVLLSFWNMVYAQVPAGTEGRIENARWSIVGNTVVITFDLVADANLEYDISIVLKRERDVSFKLVPRTVGGSIGKGKFAGSRREIRWDYKKDVPQGLYGDDYVFEFVIHPITNTGGSNVWLYLIGGATVVGGVVAIIFKPWDITGGEQSGLPDPPKSRPQN